MNRRLHAISAAAAALALSAGAVTGLTGCSQFQKWNRERKQREAIEAIFSDADAGHGLLNAAREADAAERRAWIQARHTLGIKGLPSTP